MPIISGYTIQEVIHEGAETILYRAVRDEDSRPVVLKALRRDQASARALARLRHEHEVASQLMTTAVVGCYGLDMSGEQPTLILEDFGGRALNRLLGRPLPLGTFFALALGISAALADLHRRNVVHKDIKPENLLYNPDTGQIKISDLGIASLLPREQQVAAPPALIEGTLAYMAPEQTGRMNRWVDARSDLYSLGITLYEMLTGVLPFEAHDPVEWVYCHIARQPRPPHELVPSIPPLVSELVLKLLAKAAEERYQSALGLRRDLEEAFSRWQASGTVAPYPLGQRDLSDRFQIPQRLYGREHELEVLLAAFERVAGQGRPELVLVSGYSGIGKSSLVLELHKPVVRERGFFLSGKFDQYKRDIPYLTLAQAFGGLLHELWSQSEERIARWRLGLTEALGSQGRLVTEVIPELESLLGPQPPVPALPPTEAQHRFHAVFQRFVGVFAREEHPVVLFLDDLQWADAGSLRLLEHLATDPDTKHMLLLGAFRDNEVSAGHPLMLALSEMRRRGALVTDIVLRPLSAEHLEQLVAEVVHCEPARAAPLSRLVHDKTLGNPFFAIQFLLILHQEGLLTFDHDAARWRWDIVRIHDKGFTDNVVELMAGKLLRLSAPVQEVLKTAACLGNSVDPVLLAMVAGRPEEEVRTALMEAAREGLLMRRGEAYRFLHDRVQQAAYALIPVEQRSAMHLGIGRLLLRWLQQEQLEDALFDVVAHLNQGARLLDDSAERYRLAELDLRAGRRAKRSGAVEAALGYVTTGIAVLPPGSWEEREALTYALHFEQALAERSLGHLEVAERLLDVLLQRARDSADRAEAVTALMQIYTARGEGERGIDLGLRHLRELGVDISAHPRWEELTAQHEVLWRNLGDRPIEVLVDLPRMIDPRARAVLAILAGLIVVSIYTDENLPCLIAHHAVNISITHGNDESSAPGYVLLGFTLLATFESYDAAYRIGKVGCELVDRHQLTLYKGRAYNLFGECTLPWRDHLRDVLPYIEAGLQASIEVGDVNWACYHSTWAVITPLMLGAPLDEVEQACRARIDFVRRAREEFSFLSIASVRSFAQRLRGEPVGYETLHGVTDEVGFESYLKSTLPIAAVVHHPFKTMASFLFGDFEGAVATADEVSEATWKAIPYVTRGEYAYCGALARAALWDGASQERRPSLVDGVRRVLGQLAVWAENCPANFSAKHALVSAELARIQGDEPSAVRLYERAIVAAREHGFVQHEALANELAAAFYRARGLLTSADAYLREARACYVRWGAYAKVEQLDQRYPHLVERKPIAPTVTFAVRAEQFDVLAVVKASQSISSELVLPRLLETLLGVVREHAGAEEGRVLLCRGEELVIAAAFTGPESVAQVFEPMASAAALALPHSILTYVRRTRARVLLDDAAVQNRFSDDAYLERKQPRSVLCLPIMRQTRLLGLLYLENNLVTGAFTPRRLSVLELLASQSAISLENALLYAELAEENAERRRAEQALAENQQTLQAIVDNSAALIYVKDLEGRFLLVNRYLEQIFHAPRERLLGQTDDAIVPATTAALFREHDRKVIEAGAPMEWEEELTLADGVHTYLSSKFPLPSSDGAPYALCGISTDITERKRLEQYERFLAEISRKLMALGSTVSFESVAHLPVPELADQCVIDVLEERTLRHAAAVGLSPQALAALNGALSFGAAEPSLQPVLLQGRDVPSLQRLNIHACIRVPLAARDRCLGIVSLLATAPQRYYGSAELRLSEELGRRAALALDNARLYREAQEAIRVRDEFLAIASHELKTPLTSLQLQAKLLGRQLRRDPRAVLESDRLSAMLQILDRQTERLNRLVDELLDASRLHTGRLELTPTPVDLSALTREILKRMAEQLTTAGCAVELTADAEVVGCWDGSRLEQVVTNLLSNAMKYGANKPIEVSVHRVGEGARLAVRDHGIGIAAHDQARIFERFERAVPVRNFGGLGLGLYLARSIVAAHSGSIRVESVPGAGATFIVELPPASAGEDGTAA